MKARNPQTGEIIEWDGSAWVPYKEPVEEEDLQFERNLQAGNPFSPESMDRNLAATQKAAGIALGFSALGKIGKIPGAIKSAGPAMHSLVNRLAPNMTPRTLGELAKAAVIGAGIEGAQGGSLLKGAKDGVLLATIGNLAGPFGAFALKKHAVEIGAGLKNAPKVAKAASNVVKMKPRVAKAAVESVEKAAPEEAAIIRKLSMLAKSSGANKEAVEQAAKNIFGEERYKEIMKMIMASTTRMP